MNAWKELCGARCLRVAAAAAWLGVSGVAPAGSIPETLRKPDPRLDTIVVTAQRLADEEIRVRVEAALRDDPTLMSNHLDVSIKNGVVTLSGLVFDDWDMRIARRAAKRIPGVKRVINDMEIKLGGE
jgi:osmotically-inducible protein OsmY